MIEEPNFIETMTKAAEGLIGKTVPQARKLYSRIRLLREDERTYIGTCDYDISRINIEVDNGKITRVSIG